MSSWWTEDRGGHVDSKSKEELLEMLSRQQKLLLNKRFIQTLPDKGKKISDSVEKVRRALADLEKEEKKKASFTAIGAEFQSKYQQAFTQHRHVDSNASGAARGTLKKDEDSLGGVRMDSSNMVGAAHSVHTQQDSETSTENSTEMLESTGASIPAVSTKDTELTEAFKRVSLSVEKSKDSPPRNPFFSTQSQKKPHYIEVLERSDPPVRKPKFKPNQLAEKSGSSSPGQSPGRSSPLSAEARRERDRKHLDDITAAKLPPLHHSPAQLLSLEESVTILREQTRKQQELQAKLAAQKLAEGLVVSMSTYNPEGGALAAYREVHDDGALSDED